MGYWGKVIGGVAGLFVGGPFGAVVGAALGHAADAGALPHLRLPFGAELGMASWNPMRVATLVDSRDQLLAINFVILSAKLAKCDRPVNRAEIDAFKQQFAIPAEAVRDFGRLFDQARDSPDGFSSYADQLGEVFADNRRRLEYVLTALFFVAQADGPLNQPEYAFLSRVHRGFRLDQAAWDLARGATQRTPPVGAADGVPDPYSVLGVSRSATGEALHAAWKQLMRENHPDSLAARGVPKEFIARASDKVARINAAWDRIKRERGL